MPKFSVTYERRYVQNETLTIEVEAKTLAEARKIARSRMTDTDIVEADWDTDGGDYDQHGIESIEAVTKG